MSVEIFERFRFASRLEGSFRFAVESAWDGTSARRSKAVGRTVANVAFANVAFANVTVAEVTWPTSTTRTATTWTTTWTTAGWVESNGSPTTIFVGITVFFWIISGRVKSSWVTSGRTAVSFVFTAVNIRFIFFTVDSSLHPIVTEFIHFRFIAAGVPGHAFATAATRVPGHTLSTTATRVAGHFFSTAAIVTAVIILGDHFFAI
jgi:hypothetical protein